MLKTSLLIILTGGIGAFSRFFLLRSFFLFFPASPLFVSTLVVNSLGCFLLGFLWICTAEYRLFSEETRLIMSIGFLGAFTTFSAYIFDLYVLFKEKLYTQAFFCFFLQNILGFLFLLLGMYLCKGIFSLYFFTRS